MYREGKELITTNYVHPCLPKWRGRIDAAEARGEFTEDDKDAALMWDACAVGEAHDKYSVAYRETDDYFGPVDSILRNLGSEFVGYVCDDDFFACRETITQIEQRLSELTNGK